MAKGKEENVDSMPGSGPRPGGGPGVVPVGGPGRGMFAQKVKPKNAKKTVARLWSYLGRQKKGLLITFCLVFLSSLFHMAGPFLIGLAIDKYIIPKDFNGLFKIVSVMAGVYILGVLCTLMQNYIMIGISQETVKNLRKDLFHKLQSLPLSFFDSRPHGELMSRLTNDVDNVNNTLNQSITSIFSSFITFVGTLSMMLYLSPLLTLVTMIIIPAMFFITRQLSARTRKLFKEQQEALGKINGFIEETISGQKVVKVFNREEKGIQEFENHNLNLKKIGIRAQIFSGTIGPTMNLLNNAGFALVAGVGGWIALKGMITVGVIASFTNYVKQFTRPLNELANQYNMIQSAIAGAERVFEVLEEEPEPKDEPSSVELKNIAGEVNFRDVHFSYKKENPVLKDVNLNVKPGQTIALVGPTGAGKTTIVNLLTRFYDLDKGAILVDGHDIRNVKRNSLRSSLGIVLQDTYLFSDSVRENIRYGRLNATDKEVEQAARLANADQFILRLPEGYDTILTEDGGNLSQGQRQLLSIARAILADPAILILDEATSSVDTRTELHIQEAMLTLMKGRTSFVIAHRLSTIREADLILVINGGEIIERGNHKELLAQKGFYYNLNNSQFRREVVS
jgi:ATP-binding cassette, subfamily B, multidrug efflux pump